MTTDREGLGRAVEALVMVADRPVATDLLAALTEASPQLVDDVCAELAAGYEVDGRGFILTRVAGGWRYQSHPDLAPIVERFVLEGQSSRLSSAALETLAVVAYKQPISRAQVAAIRGVNVDGVMRTLEQRGYIAEVARDPGPGQASLFGTTELFLEKLGLDHLDDLPELSGFVPDTEVVEALEQGLRPSGDPGRREAAGRTVTDRSLVADAAKSVPTEDREPSSGDREASHATTDAGLAADVAPGPAPDPLARLDETTARLDALVDEVRGRMQAAEEAVAARETADAEPPDSDDGSSAEGEDASPTDGEDADPDSNGD